MYRLDPAATTVPLLLVRLEWPRSSLLVDLRPSAKSPSKERGYNPHTQIKWRQGIQVLRRYNFPICYKIIDIVIFKYIVIICGFTMVDISDRDEEENEETINRRKVLIATSSSGTALMFSGVASAEDTSENGSKENTEPKYNKIIAGNDPELKDNKITTEDIPEKDPEEVFDEEVLNMTKEELNKRVEEKWDEGAGDDKVPIGRRGQFSISSVDENCVADELNLDKIPAIEADFCLIDDNCAIELTLGILGQSVTDELKTCPSIESCRTYSFNALSELVDITVCFNVSDLEVTISAEYCNWRPGRGWDCTEGEQTVNF